MEIESAPPPDTRHLRFNLKGRTLREHAARGTLINAAFTIGLSALGLVRAFIVAAFLTRADYGVWGVLLISLGTLLLLKQVGIGDKYIQQDEEDQELAFQKALTLELIFTGLSLVVLVAALPVFAWIYGEPRIIVPGLVMLALLPAGILQVPLWVYGRKMEFFKLRLLQAVDPLVGFVVAVVLAAAGAGYWALILGVVVGAWAAAAAAVANSPFRLRLRYERGTLRSYAEFSWPLLVVAAATMVIAQSSMLTAEDHLGLAGAGALALAATIAQFSNRVDGIVTGTLYPAICAVRHRTELLFESFVKSNRLGLMWAMPFGFGIALFAPDLVDFGIGGHWQPAVVLMQALGATAAIGHLGYNWDAYFRATGNTRPVAVAGVAAMVAFLGVGIPLLYAYALPGLAIGIAAQMLVHVSCRAYYLSRLFRGFAMTRHMVRAVLPTVTAVAAVLLWRVVDPLDRTLELALAELALYLMVTAAATWWFERRLLREVAGYLRAQPAARAA